MLAPLVVRRSGPWLQATVGLAGKRHRQGQLSTVAPGPLLRITDDKTKRRFLVDTGVSFSVLPHSGPLISAASMPNLRAANRTAIQSLGERELEVSFAGQSFKWTFLLADVEDSLLGADFLRHFGLVVDLNAGCLVQAATLQPFSDGVGTAVCSGVFSVVEATLPRLRALLSQFTDVFKQFWRLAAGQACSAAYH
jgi:hypothetical protein